MSQWIDFKKLRRELNFERVLTAYGVALNIRDTDKGRQHSGPCPIPACKRKPQAKAFSANLDHDMWQCFNCHNKGNALDLIVMLEGLNPSYGADVRKAALIAKERFLNVSAAKAPVIVKEVEAEAASMKTVINAPLDFVLKSLDASHPWFEANGLSKKTVEHFGLGYCSKGWLKGRIAIPLHDNEGRLIGYVGKLLYEEDGTSENPTYLFPQCRIHNGTVYKFDSSKVIYNWYAAKHTNQPLCLVQKIDIVWKLWQIGCISTIALMNKEFDIKQFLTNLVDES